MALKISRSIVAEGGWPLAKVLETTLALAINRDSTNKKRDRKRMKENERVRRVEKKD